MSENDTIAPLNPKRQATPLPLMNPALKSFWLAIARFRILYGGRMSGKSHDAAGFATWLSTRCTIRVVCCRQFQNKIKESVYSLIKIKIEKFGLEGQFEITDNSIRNIITGSEFMFYGIARNIDEIKSLEDIDISWLEEAHNLTQSQWEILEPTFMRKAGSQCWIVFNPRFATDFAYKRFVLNPPPRSIVRQINYDENIFLSADALQLIEDLKKEDFDDFTHIYLGVPRDNDDRAVISRSWVMACLDAHKKITPLAGEWKGGVVVGYDVADDGDDKNATSTMDGSVLVNIDEWAGLSDQLFESAQRVHATAVLHGATSIGYDSIGVGAGTGSHLKKPPLNWKNVYKFNVNDKIAKPDNQYAKTKIANKDFFSDLKAQAWWMLADRCRNTYLAVTKGRLYRAEDMFSISTEQCDKKMMNQLIEELCTPLRDYDNAGRVKVESKKDLKKRDIKSPNIADSLVIANSRRLVGHHRISEIL